VARELSFSVGSGRVSQAEAVAETDAVAAVRDADRGWQAHMTYLERRFASRWQQQSGARQVTDGKPPESMEQALGRITSERQAS